MGLGLFSIMFVVSPPVIKLLIGGVVIYAAAQIVRGFGRA